jgi:hypothetical protein
MITLDGGVDKILVAQSDWGPSWWGDATAEDIVRNYTSKDECLVDFLGEMMTELRSPKHARRKNCCLHFLSSPFSRRERQFVSGDLTTFFLPGVRKARRERSDGQHKRPERSFYLLGGSQASSHEWTRATERGGVEWDYCAVSAEWAGDAGVL